MLLGPVADADTERLAADDRREPARACSYCTHAALPLIAASGGGDIVNVSSVAGRRADAGAAVYNMTKFGVHAFSEALRQEALHAGIRVTTVAPGLRRDRAPGPQHEPARARRRWQRSREQIGEVLHAGGHRRRDRARGHAARRTCASTRSSCGLRGQAR